MGAMVEKPCAVGVDEAGQDIRLMVAKIEESIYVRGLGKTPLNALDTLRKGAEN